MGSSSSSPRALTVEEESTEGAFKVSEAVARRLVGQHEEEQTTVTQQDFVPVSEADIQEEVNELKKHYDKRIEALEKQNVDLHRVATEEFSKAVEEVERKFRKPSSPKPVCKDLQDEVMKCYQENHKQSLLCSETVKAYKTCVEEKRDSVLTRRDEDCQPCILAQMARGPCGMHFMKAYDCYLEDHDQDECGLLYLEMKECWEKYPGYGYQQIVDRAYKDTPKSAEGEEREDRNTEKTNNSIEVKHEKEETERT